MALVIDGVFFQLAQSGIARIWRATLPQLAKKLEMPIVFLDRGGVENDEFDGVEVVPFPAYKSKYNPGDSQLLEQICRHYGAKVFTSTYYSTPMETPSLLLVYDMIPERLGFDLSARDWREKELAILHARRHICISKNTRKDLLEFYPELDPDATSVAYCGIDSKVFKPREERAIAEFRRRIGLERPYYMFVGSRVQANNYKNASLFFDAVNTMGEVDFDVLCVGGEKTTPTSTVDSTGHKIVQIDLDDEDLALAYGGAAALVYPSLYEGFGLPVAEAMSSGCPVISTARGSLAEVAEGAALTIEGTSIPEMVEALRTVRDPSIRVRLVEQGARRAATFRWEPFADEMAKAIRTIAAESSAGAYTAFYRKWAALRALQGEVDVLT
ncbi:MULTISPECIES: glycosyltransferase [unclassified Variovorax]|uniref:glycosyltransferase n=1 Tax=unclassified Variovorax TaxID=663243 RepID=UPI000839A884|nr:MULTISPECIES: glycosyltransferase [unclassified Variovorax]PNG59499.1 D-inositol 3-phosphate glycosyltransferase [Variovorax sp. B4]PNG60710.1 D-inositol 3-phosphate glycosyltransferase [Variovorax sp. B2]VTV13384.1 D-inositol 3-phosphate glycosyltransferase [Variovorax sp. WDL1]